MKKRVLVSSEFLAYTGFSTVSENICELLKNDFDISIVDYSRHHNYVYKINDINYSANDNSEDRFGVESTFEEGVRFLEGCAKLNIGISITTAKNVIYFISIVLISYFLSLNNGI